MDLVISLIKIECLFGHLDFYNKTKKSRANCTVRTDVSRKFSLRLQSNAPTRYSRVFAISTSINHDFFLIFRFGTLPDYFWTSFVAFADRKSNRNKEKTSASNNRRGKYNSCKFVWNQSFSLRASSDTVRKCLQSFSKEAN